MNEREQPREHRVGAGSQPTNILIRLLSLTLTFALGTQTAWAEPSVNADVGTAMEVSGVGEDDPLLEDLSRRTFRYFWETTNKKTGLAPDRYPTPSFVSIAAIGFSFTAFVI